MWRSMRRHSLPWTVERAADGQQLPLPGQLGNTPLPWLVSCRLWLNDLVDCRGPSGQCGVFGVAGALVVDVSIAAWGRPATSTRTGHHRRLARCLAPGRPTAGSRSRWRRPARPTRRCGWAAGQVDAEAADWPRQYTPVVQFCSAPARCGTTGGALGQPPDRWAPHRGSSPRVSCAGGRSRGVQYALGRAFGAGRPVSPGQFGNPCNRSIPPVT